jgi:hypothetical protein
MVLFNSPSPSPGADFSFDHVVFSLVLATLAQQLATAIVATRHLPFSHPPPGDDEEQ